MHTNALKEMIRLGSEIDDPVSQAVAASTESGVVVGSLLKAELQAAGYTINERQLKVLTQVEVLDSDGKLLMSGTSEDAKDALRQAVFAYLRDQEAKAA